ncbi:MAG: hypothetical protein ACRDQA_22080 [Nocardioidaceae bacterium]
MSVDHPRVREHVTRLGAHLRWHGGLTLDYLHQAGCPQYIECNPRTVEPGNAAASGVDLPMLTVAISQSQALPDTPVVGRVGVRTHSAMALMLGAAERTGRRAPALRALISALACRGGYRGSTEVLTPLGADPRSGVVVLMATSQILARPTAVASLATDAVRGYAVPPSAIATVRRPT